jgi:hypothetical protein
MLSFDSLASYHYSSTTGRGEFQRSMERLIKGVKKYRKESISIGVTDELVERLRRCQSNM